MLNTLFIRETLETMGVTERGNEQSTKAGIATPAHYPGELCRDKTAYRRSCVSRRFRVMLRALWSRPRFAGRPTISRLRVDQRRNHPWASKYAWPRQLT